MKVIGQIRIGDDNDILHRYDTEFEIDNEDELIEIVEETLIEELANYLGISEKEIKENKTDFGDTEFFGITYDKCICEECPDKEICEYRKNGEFCEYSHIPYTVYFIKEKEVNDD